MAAPGCASRSFRPKKKPGSLQRNPATTIDGVKRRCGAGMGRCQGGFCGPRVLELISKTLGISPLDVLQDKAGTNVLLCETKQEENHHD